MVVLAEAPVVTVEVAAPVPLAGCRLRIQEADLGANITSRADAAEAVADPEVETVLIAVTAGPHRVGPEAAIVDIEITVETASVSAIQFDCVRAPALETETEIMAGIVLKTEVVTMVVIAIVVFDPEVVPVIALDATPLGEDLHREMIAIATLPIRMARAHREIAAVLPIPF